VNGIAAEEQPGREGDRAAALDPRANRGQAADRGQRRLHDRGAAVARPELGDGQGRPALRPRRMLHERHVDRGAGEDARTEQREQLEDHREPALR
jgi:hypothetical protein